MARYSAVTPILRFSGATVAFRTNLLSLADFKSDLSRTNLKLSSSATWPLVVKLYEEIRL